MAERLREIARELQLAGRYGSAEWALNMSHDAEMLGDECLAVALYDHWANQLEARVN